ncbi:MAG TPA: serine hydrolase, partial [Candidatus Blautia merdipullorum]|nr:serine hydrolase [Candidatus Blautia merdipullorum]
IVDLSSLSSTSAVLIDLDSGETLAEKNQSQIVYPASLTKMMTVLVALENIEDINTSVTLPEDIFPALREEGASMAGFEPGETATYQDLLYGAILPSGGECCIALARNISGSEEAFVAKMNEKAAELEMKHTHFTNTTGLQDINHYSSAEDLGAFLKEALKNQAFYEIFTADTYSVAPTNLHPEGFTFHSSMFQTMKESNIQDTYIKGGKTGFTSDAGLCLASLGEVNGKSYILVTAHADGNHDTNPYHILDAVSVYGQLAEQTQPETTTSEDETGSEE